jgi:hypothetical protein
MVLPSAAICSASIWAIRFIAVFSNARGFSREVMPP